MRSLKSLVVALSSLMLAAAAQAVVLTSPTQTGINTTLTFTFSGVQASSSNVVFAINASGDLGYDLNEFLTVSIGASGGPLTNYGNFFGSVGGHTTYSCGGFACITGTENIIISAATFNALGSSIDVVLSPGSGVNGFEPNSASVSVLYDAAAAVPEPASLALVGLGLLGAGLARRRSARA